MYMNSEYTSVLNVSCVHTVITKARVMNKFTIAVTRKHQYTFRLLTFTVPRTLKRKYVAEHVTCTSIAVVLLQIQNFHY